MNRHLSFLASAIVLILALGACSKAAPTSVRFGGPSGTMSSEFVNAVTNAPSKMIVPFLGQTTATTFAITLQETQRMARSTAFRTLASPLFDCAPQKRGEVTDGDADGIPVDSTYDVGCTAGDESLSGVLRVRDQNDTLGLGKAGYFLDLSASRAIFLNNDKAKVELTADASHFHMTVVDGALRMEASALGSVIAGNAKVTAGFEGSATYSGELGTMTEGSTGSGSGVLKYEGIGIPEVPDASFTVKVEGSFTIGQCATTYGITILQPKTGSATIQDASNNIIRVTLENCAATATFNGNTISLQGKTSVRSF